MSRNVRGLCLAAVFCLIFTGASRASDELVANPFFSYWSGFKPGSVAVHVERTRLSGEDGGAVPGGVEEKRIAYKLIEVGPERVVLEMVVTEQELLGYVQASPTRYIYPAKIKKSHLDRIIEETGVTVGEEVLTLDGKEHKCKTLTATVKRADGEQIESKMWLSAEVPGHVIKRIRTTRQNGELVAETTTVLESHTKAD